jgi:hypothetical protein
MLGHKAALDITPERAKLLQVPSAHRVWQKAKRFLCVRVIFAKLLGVSAALGTSNFEGRSFLLHLLNSACISAESFGVDGHNHSTSLNATHRRNFKASCTRSHFLKTLAELLTCEMYCKKYKKCTPFLQQMSIPHSDTFWIIKVEPRARKDIVQNVAHCRGRIFFALHESLLSYAMNFPTGVNISLAIMALCCRNKILRQIVYVCCGCSTLLLRRNVFLAMMKASRNFTSSLRFIWYYGSGFPCLALADGWKVLPLTRHFIHPPLRHQSFLRPPVACLCVMKNLAKFNKNPPPPRWEDGLEGFSFHFSSLRQPLLNIKIWDRYTDKQTLKLVVKNKWWYIIYCYSFSNTP